MIENLAPQVGLEPTTLRLTAECSTIELLRSKAEQVFLFRSERLAACQTDAASRGGSGVLEEELQPAIFRRAKFTNNMPRQIFPGQLGRMPRERGFHADDFVEVGAAKLVRCLENRFHVRSDGFLPAGPDRENHREAGHLGPLGAQIEHMVAERSADRGAAPDHR